MTLLGIVAHNIGNKLAGGRKKRKGRDEKRKGKEREGKGREGRKRGDKHKSGWGRGGAGATDTTNYFCYPIGVCRKNQQIRPPFEPFKLKFRPIFRRLAHLQIGAPK